MNGRRLPIIKPSSRKDCDCVHDDEDEVESVKRTSKPNPDKWKKGGREEAYKIDGECAQESKNVTFLFFFYVDPSLFLVIIIACSS